ncbi:replicative DNA helicase [Nocardioides humi]|uniref:Replicative DNA helicase n=3 Tax=Nocardioides humi TaxID=449461 RepID=A0ABN1ZXC4_9ACTN|nr:replicative DNA helicase [Nocardioides humi]
MSLTDDPPAWTAEPSGQWGDGPAPYAPGEAPSGGRTPPQDMAAEQSVLGAMMISKDAIADVVEVLRGADYYRPAHEEIHEAILDLYSRGEPADMVTVAGELQRRGQLQKIGGAPYLHTLAANVPIAANAGFYAEIVYEKAILRRLVNAGTKIVQISYAGEGEVEGIVNEAQSEIYKVTDRNKSEDYAPLSDIMDGVLDEIEAIENREAGIYGVPTGFADLDELTNGLHAGQMIVVAARPAMGKSTLALDFCRAASVGHNLTSAFFSLEMTRAEIVMRLLSAEARIPLNHIRNGKMGTEEWDRLARHVAKVSAAPMFVDDSPNMTMTEIRAKARRLKQKHDLKLMVIDYLQLMSSGKKVESRQLEVSEFSRQMKLLAKELEIPIIALSQLNRGPEQRADKRPAMSDLRESGCLTADTRLMRADTNAEITLGELMDGDVRDIPVWALDDRLKLVPRTLTHAFPSGTKPVYEVTLASGRRVKATGNHPFLTYDGWMPLAELEVGSRVGAIRHVPPPLEIAPRDPNEIVLLGHMIGDGSFVKRQPIRYASVDEHNLQTVAWAARQLFGIEAIRDEYPAARVTTLRLPAPYRLTHGKRNPIAEWLDEMGLFGLRSHEKFVPDWVFSLPKEQVALFLRSIWATDGCIHLSEADRRGAIYYGSTSRRLADDVARLLARFNVFAQVRGYRKGEYRICYQVHVSGAENQLRFLDDIGASGSREDAGLVLAEFLRTVRPQPGADRIPARVWDDVRQTMSADPVAVRELMREFGSAATMTRTAPGRQKLFRIASILGDSDLALMATNDIYWDEIRSVELVGEMPVFDATVLGVHNFVANGIALHNSIEQDADMVILLHRDDVYEKESTRPGEADLIVAKHRNGATRDIVVAFQGHYSRFVDMAH